MSKQADDLRKANELLRSAYQIALRGGQSVNWGAFRKQLLDELEREHRILWPEQYQDSKSPKQYCAVGDYGIEAAFDTEDKCQEWIDQTIAESKTDQSGIGELGTDYYHIQAFTKAELDALPED